MKRFPVALAAMSVTLLSARASVELARGDEVNLVANGSFEQVRDSAPVDWSAAGDAGVRQTLSLQTNAAAGRCAKLACTAYTRRGPSSHAMLAQVGKVALKKGQMYRLSCRLRAERLRSRYVRVAISDTASWSNCGLQAGFSVGRSWRPFEAFFTATRTVDRASRLQFWFAETGTLWIDDIRIVPVSKLSLAFTGRIEPGPTRNLLPNGSFEAGRDGWASLGTKSGWGNLSGLYGEVVDGAARDGRKSLRIVLQPGTTPVTYFDYFEPVRVVQRSPLAANVGWIRVERGRPYTLSAWMRSGRDGVPARLLVRQCDPAGWPNDSARDVVLSTQWRRYALTVTPRRGHAFVAAGPDLSRGRTDTATVWLDAVQFEQAPTPGEFVPREPIEVGLETRRFGHVFFQPEHPYLRAVVANSSDHGATVELRAQAVDFFGKTLPIPPKRIEVRARQRTWANWALRLDEPGHYTVGVSWRAGGKDHRRTVRMALVPRHRHEDSPFGINHAPPTAELCSLLRAAGIVWARDWSLKWQHVEPRPGAFDPSPADVQIDRVLATGMKQLCLLPPFPSSNWASSAPKSLDTTGYPGTRLAMAYAPKNPKLLADYIERCVRHFKGRVKVWDFLNEPIYTNYSLPGKGKGAPGAAYTVKDYVALLKLAYAAMKRADASCRVLGGIGAGPDHLTREFAEAGGLEACDILNLHTYPGSATPESYLDPLARLGQLMARHGKVKPIWFTEYSYYATDEPPWKPFVGAGSWASARLLRDERQAADYAVRFAVCLLASGVEKVFYHSGASGEVNRPTLECCLLGYAGSPRKAYVAQAVLADVLAARPTFAKRLTPPGQADGVYAFAFDCGDRAVVVAWVDPDLAGDGWRLTGPDSAGLRDIVGRRQPAGPCALTSSPMYVIAPSTPAGKLADACRLDPPGK